MLRHLLLMLVLLQASVITAWADEAMEIGTVEYREIPREFRLDGVVEAVSQSTVSAQTPGQVEEVRFDVDDLVEKGTIIVRLKDTEQQARLAQSEADLKAASARFQEAADEYNRIKGVFEKKLVSQAAMDKASTDLKATRARRDAAEAQLQQAREQLEYTRVRAPYSGIVTHRYIEVGEIATPGQKLMSGIALEKLRVNVDVPQSLIPAIRKLGKARVKQPGNGYVAASKLTIFPYAHHGSNTFKVRLELPEGVENMFPGMFVKTAFLLGKQQQLVLPTQSIVHRSEVTGVYVQAADGRISLRHIRAGHELDDETIVVLAGLEAGEQVALNPIAAGARLKQQRSKRNHD